jgi:hypothetical protein
MISFRKYENLPRVVEEQGCTAEAASEILNVTTDSMMKIAGIFLTGWIPRQKRLKNSGIITVTSQTRRGKT